MGFSDRERTLFSSVFNLSRSRALRYIEFNPEQHPHADFFVIDTNDRSALDVFVKINPASYGGALFVGDEASRSGVSLIKRPIRWAELLLKLDELPRPMHPAQVAALVAAGLVQPEHNFGEAAAQTEVPLQTGVLLPTLPAALVANTVVRRQENDVELASLNNWYDREHVTTFKTEAAVMVVDPDIAARRYMAAKFIDLKYRVDYAESGEQALEMLREHRYNAVFMEITLPGMDGFEVCKLVKTKADRRRIAVVIVTSRTSTFDRVKGAMAGCDAYLTKPIDQDKLVFTLDKFLPNWRLQLPIV
jgi:twitching motility two-component system response regulator PilG